MPNEEDGAVDNDENIFEKIINSEAPADVVYEDEQVSPLSLRQATEHVPNSAVLAACLQVLAFRNIRPLVPVHVLVVPKKTIKSLQDAKDEVGS